MQNDPRVAPSPMPMELKELFDMGLPATAIEQIQKANVAQRYIAMRRDALEAQQAGLQNQALGQLMQQQAGLGQASANQQANLHHYGQIDVRSFAPRRNSFPNMSIDQITIPDEVTRNQQAQDAALTKMNPIARTKYEPVFKLLDIKLRHANDVNSQGAVWLVAKMAKNGKMYRQSWGVDTTDPGGSLRVWDCMVSELLDTIARADGYDTNTDTSAPVAGG